MPPRFPYLSVEQPFIVRHMVNGENIQKYPLIERKMKRILYFQNSRRGGIAQLRVAAPCAGVRIFCLEKIRELKISGALAKPVIFGTEQHHVYIIVPGDKSPVPHSSQNRSRVHIVGNPVFFTYPVKLRQQVQLDGPYLFHLSADGIPAADFFPQKSIR